MTAARLKVGALAKLTGLTVRTLHHYDEIGLLTPAGRTPAGHRLYADEDVRRLQHIASLRHVGLSLDEIKGCLANPGETLERALRLQVKRIEEQIEQQRRLHALVEELRRSLQGGDSVSIEELAETIEATNSYAKYYTADQLDRLRTRREAVGALRISEVQQEWAVLFAAFGRAMRDGLDPGCGAVQELARRAKDLVGEFTGGDPGIADSLRTRYREEGGERVLAGHGFDLPPGLWEYMAEAQATVSEGR